MTANGNGARGDEPPVIGRETAAAHAAEQRHRATAGAAPSPLAGVHYDLWHGDFDLARVVPTEADRVVAAVVDDYAAGGGETRAAIRHSLTMEDFSTLLTFSRRQTVYALQTMDQAVAEAAVGAVTPIVAERTDWRDIVVALGLASYALRRVAPNADEVLPAVADRAEPQVAAMVERFIEPTGQDSSLAGWGYMEIETADGVGLIERSIAPYAPSVDLPSIALQVADVIDQDRYRVTSIAAATEMAQVWLPGADPRAVGRVLGRVRGCVTVNAGLHPAAHPRADAQQFSVFLVEAGDESDAHRLHQWSATTPGSEHCSVAARNGPLFALTIARSFVHGVDAYESDASIDRFRTPIDAILAGFTAA